ncbi:MAG: glycosyltransferase family 1 protein [Acidimicrobiales bacterium]
MLMGEQRLAVTLVVDQLRQRPTSGIATYSRGLLQGLRAMGDAAPALTLAASRAPVGPDALAAWGLPVHSSPLPGRLATRAWGRDLGTGFVGRGASAPQVLHATSFATPYPKGVPVAMMIHDLAWREVPETFPERGRRWHEAALARAITHAQLIITPSQRTAELVAAAGMPDAAIEVIAEGSDHLPPADPIAGAALLQSLGVTGPYLLSVSTLEPRKNLERLMDAYVGVRERLPDPWPLVVVGPSGWGPQLAPRSGVKLAGPVSDPVLVSLYQGARCLAYVPLVEGWGLPPVEAMAACTPVVASPMPSTAGAGIEVDPCDVAAIGRALVVASADEARRSELVTAGLLRVRDLTWERAAVDHAAAWERLL